MLENTRSPRHARLRAGPFAAWIAALLLSAPLLAGAAVIVRFTSFDLPDTVIGQDLRGYDYVISGGFSNGDTLTLEFPFAAYDQIKLETPPTTLSPSLPLLQPDSVLGTRGLLLLTAVSTLPPTFQDSLRVSFVSVAGGSPGAQPFQVIDSGFSTIQTSFTVSATAANAVPEPATGGLLAAGLALFAVLRRSPFPRGRSLH